MQKFGENTLRNLAKGINTYFIIDYVEEFVSDLEEMMQEIIVATKRTDISCSIQPFGAYSFLNISNQKEYINIAVILNSDNLFKETNEIGKNFRFKNKRKKVSYIEQVKLLIVILLEKYFAHRVNIKMNHNSLLIDSLTILGCNFRVFVFTQSFDNNELLTISSYDYLPCSFNIDKYEENFAKKDALTNSNYSKMCNIIKSVCIDENISDDMLSIDFLLYNIDNMLLKGFINEQLFNIFNECKFMSYNNFVCMDSKNNVKLFTDRFLFPNGIYKTKVKFNKLVDFFLEN